MPEISKGSRSIKGGARECFSGGGVTPMTPALSGSPVGKVPSSTEVMTPCVKPGVTDRQFTWLEVKLAQC